MNMYDIVVPLAIASSKEAEERFKFLNKIPYRMRMRDVRTIHLNFGRTTGKSDYIKRHATNEDMVVSPNRFITQVLLEKSRYKIRRGRIISVPNFDLLKYRGIEPIRNLYIDEPRIAFERYNFNLGLFLDRNPVSGHIIMLGE